MEKGSKHQKLHRLRIPIGKWYSIAQEYAMLEQLIVPQCFIDAVTGPVHTTHMFLATLGIRVVAKCYSQIVPAAKLEDLLVTQSLQHGFLTVKLVERIALIININR